MSQDIFSGETAQTAAWAGFDADWYARRYLGDIAPNCPEAVLEHYLAQGAGQGHSPNPFFDETWYRLRHPEVVAAIAQGEIASGFADYCRDPHDGRSPHWLFDAGFYLSEAGFVGGYVNGYDHFLSTGDKAGLRPSVFFLAPTLLA